MGRVARAFQPNRAVDPLVALILVGVWVTTLLLLWPAGLLFPAPLPLGLGQIGAPVRQLLARLLADIDWAGPSEPTGQLGQLVNWLGSPSPLSPPLPNLVEALFTDFPGRNGETVRISVAPEKNKR